MGAGIAGVGIPAEIKGEGIMVIKDRSKYREWEFIYDPKEDKNIVGPAGLQPGGVQNANPLGGQSPTGATGTTGATPTPPPQPPPQ